MINNIKILGTKENCQEILVIKNPCVGDAWIVNGYVYMYTGIANSVNQWVLYSDLSSVNVNKVRLSYCMNKIVSVIRNYIEKFQEHDKIHDPYQVTVPLTRFSSVRVQVQYNDVYNCKEMLIAWQRGGLMCDPEVKEKYPALSKMPINNVVISEQKISYNKLIDVGTLGYVKTDVLEDLISPFICSELFSLTLARIACVIPYSHTRPIETIVNEINYNCNRDGNDQIPLEMFDFYHWSIKPLDNIPEEMKAFVTDRSTLPDCVLSYADEFYALLDVNLFSREQDGIMPWTFNKPWNLYFPK